MRSRNCTVEGPDDRHIQPAKGFIKQGEENTPDNLTQNRKMKVQREEKDGRTGAAKKTSPKPGESQRAADLSKKDLLQLLGIMEGEVQVSSC